MALAKTNNADCELPCANVPKGVTLAGNTVYPVIDLVVPKEPPKRPLAEPFEVFNLPPTI